MAARMTKGVPQADGSIQVEPVMDVANVGKTVAHMASLPMEANVQFVTVWPLTCHLLAVVRKYSTRYGR